MGGIPPLSVSPWGSRLCGPSSDLSPSPQQQVQPRSSVHRLFCPGGSAPGRPGHHRLLPVPAAGPAGQAHGHLTEPAAGEPAHEASQACVPHLPPDVPHPPSFPRDPIPAPSWAPSSSLGLEFQPLLAGFEILGPSLRTLFPGHWGHPHTVPPVPTASKPLNKMRVATPMLMQALPMSGLLQGVRTTPGHGPGGAWVEGRGRGPGEDS